jgi:hypothetical protein
MIDSQVHFWTDEILNPAWVERLCERALVGQAGRQHTVGRRNEGLLLVSEANLLCTREAKGDV